ncbi:MAG: UDP-N-acetylmuramoyl-L-alanyl-D-glutamate--2,6-diaminopimelate ligase [Coprobacillaceae bacterium]
MKQLQELFNIDNDMKIYSIHSDSRYVKPYSIFFCIEGLSVDGHQYVEDAIFQGAKCIVHSKELEEYRQDIIYIKVEDTLDELNRVANLYYDYPSKKMKMVGITGTTGKIVVASMIKNALAEFCKTGYIGTISLEYDGNIKGSPYTTPETLYLQRNLYRMYKHGVKIVAMEASSHGLYLRRVDGIHFDIAVLTNIGDEHLDFHGTKEQYIQAKLKLFKKIDEHGIGIINKDDANSTRFIANTKGRVITYGIASDADVMAKNIVLSLNKTFLDLHIKGEVFHISTPTIGMFNVNNVLALASVLLALGSDNKTIMNSLQKIAPVPGRMEVLQHELPFHIIVDYCQSLVNYEEVFSFVKKVKEPKGRLIAVFGAPGKRHVKDRAALGKLVNTYCDHAILTQMDDRGEDVESICSDIQKELKDINSVIITSRQIAIEQAVELACKDDVILILGKGHEQFISLSVGKADYPGDKIIALEAIKRIYGGEEDDEIQYYD